MKAAEPSGSAVWTVCAGCRGRGVVRSAAMSSRSQDPTSRGRGVGSSGCVERSLDGRERGGIVDHDEDEDEVEHVDHAVVVEVGAEEVAAVVWRGAVAVQDLLDIEEVEASVVVDIGRRDDGDIGRAEDEAAGGREADQAGRARVAASGRGRAAGGADAEVVEEPALEGAGSPDRRVVRLEGEADAELRAALRGEVVEVAATRRRSGHLVSEDAEDLRVVEVG